MHLLRPHNTSGAPAPTPDSVFAGKYEWLLRWAMHFTQNDRAVAEDLVQDAFVRLIVSWARIKDNLDEVEPFLYSSLKYAHLMELRRGRRFNFQDLAIIEFDDLRIILKEEKGSDPIEVQDDLRRIVAYLCWRKRTTKSASILLLRFFHGYFPEEIARIALISRNVVDKRLSLAREEVKACLADPSRIEVMRQEPMPKLMPRQVAVSPEHLAEELRATIFQSRTSPCLRQKELLQRYQTAAPQPISTEMLAHIVSCRECLQTIHSILDFPEPPQRSSGGMASSSRRSKRNSGTSGIGLQDQIRHSIDGGRERFRRIYEHHPRALMISVNGDLVAMRDVNSATSELMIQTPPQQTLTLIDVLSEQGFSLLNLYVATMPPHAQPELRQEIVLSDNRRLDLLLRFTSEGAVIELHYVDPLFQTAADDSCADDEEEDDEPAMDEPQMKGQFVASAPPLSLWFRFVSWFASLSMPEINPFLVTGTVCAIAAVILFALSIHHSGVIRPTDFLARADAVELTAQKSGQHGVVVQAVRIRTSQTRIERTVYRDVEGLRHPKIRVIPNNELTLANTLAAAGVRWDDPLSPGSFDSWHGRASVLRDTVHRTGDGLLTLTTTVSDRDVVSESLIVRATDFHTVGKSIQLRDQGLIEIAEVSYGVVPWNSISPDIFDPLSTVSESDRRPLSSPVLPHLPREVSTEELDLAELSARLVLNRLALDDNGRIEIIRGIDGVHVHGIVDTAAQKEQLQAQLRTVSHVLPSIATIQEVTESPASGSPITSIGESSESAEAPSSLERYFTEHGLDHEQLPQMAQEIVDSAFMVRHEAEQITFLSRRFVTNSSLSGEARAALGELLIQHKIALFAGLGREERALMAAQLAEHPSATAAGVEDTQTLLGDAETNRALCVELASANAGAPRPAQVIAPQLVQSIARLRAAALQISITQPPHPSSPGAAGIAGKNK